MLDFLDSLTSIKETYNEIYVIVAPPRTSSTAFSRVFWNHPQVDIYCHEPFDRVYHRQEGLMSAIEELNHPMRLNSSENKQGKENLVIKEMTFQVGKYFPLLASLTAHPVIFLIRDPRLSILSRMRKRKEGGLLPIFPPVESGWHDLHSQVMLCKKEDIPYFIIDSKDFRDYPERIFKIVLERVGLSLSQEIFSWKPVKNVVLGTLNGEQSHWYKHVLKSSSIEPESQLVSEMVFPENHGLQAHVKEALEIYKSLRQDKQIILPHY